MSLREETDLPGGPMARRIYNFDNPDRFVAGALGQAGNRTFYLQARDGERIISVVLEKVQVGLLAERLTQLLSEVRARGASVPDEPAAADMDTDPLDEPVHITFRVGTMAIVWDGDEESVVVEARALAEDDDLEGDVTEIEAEDDTDDDVDDESDVVRVNLEPRTALAFAQRALEVVAAGRPPCPFCGQPLNPEGHICARRNGFMH
jgi:uncharacterized repeat protein (TIGR03847 family)